MVNNSDEEKRVYFGASNTTFKDRYRNLTRELPKYIWQLKRNKKLNGMEKYQKSVYDAKRNYCFLCLKEKYFIINCSHEEILVNIRSKLISK